MRFPGFIGPSYTLQSLNVECQRTMNMYPEINELGTGEEGEVASLVSTPGLLLLCTLPTGPVRGNYTDSTGQLWAVGGNTLYQISSTWVASAVGILNTTSGAVSFSDNGIELVVVDGPYGYSCVLGLSASYLPPTYSSTVTNAGITTLVAGDDPSNFQQYFTGSTTETVVLPDATTMIQGNGFNIVNLSSGAVTVQTSGGNTIQVMTGNTQLYVVCSNISGGTGTASWTWTYSTISTNTFSQIIDPNFQGAAQVIYIDSTFVYNKPSSNEWYLGPENAVTPFDGTLVAEAESQPEDLVGLIELQENIWLLSGNHVEVWYDSGANDFPYTRIQGAVFEQGCAAAFSIAKIQNQIFWLSQDETGQGVVYMAQGLQPKRISTFAIENEFSQLGNLSGARAWVYQQNGHAFYCLNIPGATTTWCYDVATGMWHERAYLSQGQYARHLADCHAYAYNTNVVGDYSSGNLYSLSITTYTDNGNAIVRERTAPHIGKDLNRIFHHSFWLDMETGVGTTGTNQGNNPMAVLTWSNDWGHSWSNEHWVMTGKIGSRKARVIWRRLGQARDRVYRVKISDPIKVTMLGAELDMEVGAA